MEEKDDDIIYDLGSAESPEEQTTQSAEDTVMESGHVDRCAEGAVTSTECGISDDSEREQEAAPDLAPEGTRQVAPDGAAVSMTALHNADNADDQLRKMVEDMGAETLLEIIRDNRNAAIRQILSEVEAARTRSLPSGNSVVKGCSSIFDLAAMA